MRLLGRINIFSLMAIVFPFLLAGTFFLFSAATASSLDVNLTVGICNSDGTCDTAQGETFANCSADCDDGGGGGGGSLTITSTTVSGITSSGAGISWLVDKAARCNLSYGLDTDYASSTIVGNNELISHAVILSGLSSSTTYHFKIQCQSVSGDKGATGDNFFTTESGEITITDLAISEIAVTNISDRGADIAWKTDHLATCQARWGINTDYGVGASSEVGYFISHQTRAGGLAPEQTYHFIIDCQDAEEITATSGDRDFQTLEEADTTAPGNVLGLRSQSGNGTTTLFWRNPADPDYAGVIIRRSTSYYPSFTQGTMIYDGRGVSSGAESYFADSGLTNEVTYYYTVFSYDDSRNYASGAGAIGRPTAGINPPPPTCATDPTLCPPPGGSGILAFADFDFYQLGQKLSVGAGDRVSAQPDLAIDILLSASKALRDTDKMVLNLSVAGRIETYIFAYDADSQAYAVAVPPIKDAAVYFVSIVVLDAGNQALKIVSGSIEIKAPIVEILPSVPATVDAVVEAVEAVRQSPLARAISQAAQTPLAQGTAAATVALSFAASAITIPLLNWWFLLQFLFTQPLRLLWFRKGWGTVYNAITKKPVDLALVRLFDAKTDTIVASRVTDKNGRYIFLVDPGEYYIKVEKSGFDYPSSLLKRAHDDGSFPDLYYGEKISIAGENRSAIIANIPIDQQDVRLTDAEVLKRFSRAKLSQGLSWLGPALAMLYFIFAPSLFSFGLIVVHLLLLFLIRRLAGRKHRKHWGVVFSPDGKNPIKRAVTRVFSSEYGRMLEFYVTDNQGRYDFLVGNNKYYVTADKSGFGTAKTPVLDLTGKKPEDLVIAQDLVLPTAGTEAAAEPIEDPVEAPVADESKPEDEAAAAPEPAASALPPVGPIDLGSLDEAKEMIDARSNNTNATTAAEPKKSDENIYG